MATKQGEKKFNQIKSLIILAVLRRSVLQVYRAYICVIVSANTVPFEDISQRCRAIGNSVSDLTGARFEPQTSRSKDERVTWSV